MVLREQHVYTGAHIERIHSLHIILVPSYNGGQAWQVFTAVW